MGDQSIVDQVVKQCHDRGHAVTPQLAAFVLRSLEGADDLFEGGFALGNKPSSSSPGGSSGQLPSRRAPRTARSLARLVAAAVERASAADSPALDLLKMQVAFSEAVAAADARRAAERAAEKAERQRYLAAVVESRRLSESALDGMFANVVSYVAVKEIGSLRESSSSAAAAVGGATDRRTRREVSAIAERVLPRRTLADLALSSPAEKESSLKELSEIVAGIRILQAERNAESSKEEAAMPSATSAVAATASTMLPPLAPLVAVPSLSLPSPDKLASDCLDFEQRLAAAAAKLQTAVQQYTAVLRHAHNNPGDSKAQPKAGVARLTEELAHRWQALLFVRGITADVADMRPRITELAALYRQHLSDLGTAAATTLSPELYTGFRMLARIRRQLSDESALLEDRASALEAISQHMLLPPAPATKRAGTSSPAALSPSSGQRAQQLPAQPPIELSLRQVEVDCALEALAGLSMTTDTRKPAASELHADVSVLEPADFARWQSGETISERGLVSLPAFSESAVSLRGFCPTTLVSRQGLLIEGNRSVGAVVLHNRFYRFASWDALYTFAKDPSIVLDGIRELIRSRPELVLLLDMANDPANAAALAAAASAPIDISSAVAGSGHGMADASQQTEVHVEQSKIVRGYHWNEWELRRRAVQLADLRNKRTVSTQTASSFFRRENDAQVYHPKTVGTQTGVDEATGTPTRRCYLAGLRGGEDRLPRTVVAEWDLTDAHRTNFVQMNMRR